MFQFILKLDKSCRCPTPGHLIHYVWFSINLNYLWHFSLFIKPFLTEGNQEPNKMLCFGFIVLDLMTTNILLTFLAVCCLSVWRQHPGERGWLTVAQAIHWGMQSVFWPVSLDQCAVGPWLLQAEFNSSTEPWAHHTHNLHKRTNTHMLTWGIVRYMSTEWMSTERMCMFCSSLLSSSPHPPLLLLSSPFLPYLWQTSTQAHLDVWSFHITLFSVYTFLPFNFCILSTSVYWNLF